MVNLPRMFKKLIDNRHISDVSYQLSAGYKNKTCGMFYQCSWFYKSSTISLDSIIDSNGSSEINILQTNTIAANWFDWMKIDIQI